MAPAGARLGRQALRDRRGGAADGMKVTAIGGGAWFAGALEALLGGGGRFVLAEAAEGGAGIAILTAENGEAARAELTRLRRRWPELRVVVRFAMLRADLVRDAMEAGAWGCVGAEDAPGTLIRVLESVAEGRASFPWVDLSRLRDDPYESLTRREREVLAALVKGWSNLQISARLGISENTVKYHLRLIYDKLGVANRATAVARFMHRVG